jgi:hypothetical protein
MSKIVNKVVEIGTLGREKDITGVDAASKAAQRAAGVQAEAGFAGIEEQRRQFDITQGNLQPFQEAGVGALGQQQALLGLSGQEAQQAAFSGLEESAGQRFLRDRQQKALLRNSAAIGGLGGGNVRTALQEQSVGFAQQDIQNQFGRLGQLAGQGQQAVTTGGQLGGQAASNIANLQSNVGAAQASGILAPAQQEAAFTNQLLQLAGAAAGAA